jgi:large subunit ribosomal protein L23
MKNNPYEVVKHMLVSEKSSVLMGLKDAQSNACLKKCKSPKYVFVVDIKANKSDIKSAIEEIYKKKGITVVAVNTITGKTKPRMYKGKLGTTKPFKKAVVTLKEGDSIDELE